MEKESVEWFAKQMLKKLEENINKRNWIRTSYDYLFNRMKEEVKELQELLLNDKVPYKHKKMITECANVAKYAMMIADKANKESIY